MVTAHEQYYTQPEAGAIHITWDAYSNVMMAKSQDYPVALTLHQETVYSFAEEMDTYVCRDCAERKGWHSYWGGPHGSDSTHWEGDFYVLDEEGLEILCESCFDEITAEPEYEDEPASYISPQTRALMTVIDSFFKKC